MSLAHVLPISWEFLTFAATREQIVKHQASSSENWLDSWNGLCHIAVNLG